MPMNTAVTYDVRKETRLHGRVLFTVCVALFALMSYGGIRSSDSEVVFRMGESIATRGSLALEHDLEEWHAFGVAFGRNHALYSIFGPLESIVIAPIIKVADWINETEWYVPLTPMLTLSHFTEGGFYNYVQGVSTKAPRPHALRMLSAIYNVLVSAFGVFVFWKILLLLTKSIPSSFLVSVIYAFATHVWPYSGTFFSEPLATLMVLLSFLYLLKSDEVSVETQGLRGYRPVFWSGILMGLAIVAHITAALYAPFFAFYFFWKSESHRSGFWQRVERAAVYSFGVFILVFILGWFNFYRFGSFFETGRTISAISGEIFGYGVTVFPLQGLFGLLFGAGKGIVFFMPVLVLSSFLWRSFFKEDRMLFWVVFAAVAFRVLFIASRSDWHAGFCIGARYLVMAIPFFLIPLAFWLKNHEATKFNRAFGLISAAGFLFAVEQFYFCLAEVFTFLQILKFRERYFGIDVFNNDLLYLNWKYSPLTNYDQMRISPFFLRYSGLSFGKLMLFGTILIAILFAIFFVRVRMMPRSLGTTPRQAEEPSSHPR
jgi:hypothetical protein